MVEIGATGEGVRVALIDSGINAGHPHVGGVAGGVGLHRTADAIKEQPEFSDVNGHGTACAGVVRWMAASADIFSVRVLGPDLLCDGE